MSEPTIALTSLSPAQTCRAIQLACVQSWRTAGLRVVSCNHPSEIAILRSFYDVEFVPVKKTSMATFGRHYVPISEMLRWAGGQDSPVLLINADIEVRLTPGEFRRIRCIADGGLCYFIRWNHNGDPARAVPEPHGIDAFLLHSRDCGMFADSFLSMGQPFWDYWLPHIFVSHGRRIHAVEFAATLHRRHELQWSWENHHRCGLEFDRMAGLLGADRSDRACNAMSIQVRQKFERAKTSIPQRPGRIREWVQRTFDYRGGKMFLELGAHRGGDTAWMARVPDVWIHAFEPDPRNYVPPARNVTVHRKAISDRDGSAPFILSKHGWEQEWTQSSSIKAPLNHLTRYPVTFGESVEVEAISLDSVSRIWGLGRIDFIWADIQGAEGDMIRGGAETLRRTRFLYTEFSDEEMYAGQPKLSEILGMLPGYRVVELWQDDVLLENTQVK